MSGTPVLVRFSVFAVVSAALCALPACKGKEEPVAPVAKITGKVTCDGQDVPYGVVLFYNPQKSLDEKTGGMKPLAFGFVVEGKYEVSSPVTGPMMVCVATSPDLSLEKLLQPYVPSPGTPGGGKEGGGQIQAGKKVDPGKGPPVADAPGAPKKGGVGLPGSGGPGGPPGGNPVLQKLTAEQKKLLYDLHERYGHFGKSGLVHEIKEGDQSWDIKLTRS